MTTLSIRTKVTVDDFVEAAEQLPTAELEQLARRLMYIQARRKAPHLSQREAELLEEIAQTDTFAQQGRYHDLNTQMEHRSLTQDEQNELRELIAQSKSHTAHRPALLVELLHLRRIFLPTP